MFDNIGLMDKSKLIEIFDYLNERLYENQLQLEITVYGGSIMAMVYDNRPATKDIDCVFSETNDKLLSNILDLAKFTFNLSDGWINEEIKEPLRYLLKEDKETFKIYSNLKIIKPKADQLLAMKILAARPIKPLPAVISFTNRLLREIERYDPASPAIAPLIITAIYLYLFTFIPDVCAVFG